jgi:hypothetical protein
MTVERDEPHGMSELDLGGRAIQPSLASLLRFEIQRVALAT